MIPIDFPEKTKTLKRPPNMSEKECSPLDVFCDGTVCISKWTMTFKEKIHCLFKGFVWLSVRSGKTQPPVKIEAKDTVFIKA